MAKKADLKRTRKLIKGMTIPSRPTVMLEVIKALDGFAPDLQAVAEVISRDLVLSSRVLQEANTTLPGLKRRVSSIQQAAMLLGLRRVRRLVTGLFLSTSLMGKGGTLHRLRHRYAEAGRTAAALAKELPRISPACQSGYLPPVESDEAYTLGLFHDCGLSLLMQRFADYEGFYDEVRKKGQISLVAAEDDRFRTNHCLVGYVLCEDWQLPEPLCQTILTHHKHPGFMRAGKKAKNRKTLTLQSILRLSEWIDGEISIHEWESVRGDLLGFLDMDDTQLEQLRDRVQHALRSSGEED